MRKMKKRSSLRCQSAILCVSVQTVLRLRRLDSFWSGCVGGVGLAFTDVSDVLQLPVQQAGVLGVNSCNTDGFMPLHVAALHGHAALAVMLIRHGANVNARTNQSTTPLHLASQNSHIQVGPSELGQVLLSLKL